MFKGIIFVAMMFCMGVGALFGGSMALYENVDYFLHGRSATMELADSSKKIAIPPAGGYDVHFLSVRYQGPKGQLVVPNKRLSGAVARRLANGEKIPIIYFENNPQKLLLSKDELPSPWLWLFLGAALSGTFIYALKLLRRESVSSVA